MENYRVGLLGGIVCSILPNLPIEDIIVTLCMATFGTITSFLVTLSLRWASKKMEKM
jgi:hypothetical protein